MTATTSSVQTRTPTQAKLEFGIRFVTLGVPGFLIFTVCCLALVVELLYGEPFVMPPLLGLPIAFFSGLMILGGTGQWGRWAYMWIFLSIPFIASIWALLPPFVREIHSPDENLMDRRLVGLLVFGLPLFLSYAFVRRYYRRNDSSRTAEATL